MRTVISLIIFISILCWPLSLYLYNSHSDFLIYFIPGILLSFSYFLLKRGQNYYFLIPIVIIPLISPKLSILPPLFILLNLISSKQKRVYVLFLIISILIAALQFNSYKGQLIFKPNYEKRQEILRNSMLYPNVFLARVFQNKGYIYVDKLNNNFFSLIDPNNYFFGFHPREIKEDNQNLVKFPFITLLFFVFGLITLHTNKDKKFIYFAFIASITTLTLLENFDRNDFILWFPAFLVIVWGIKELKEKLHKKTLLLFSLTAIFSIIDLVKIFIEKRI